MKRLAISLLAMGLACTGNVAAQSSGYYPAQDDVYRDKGYRDTQDYASQEAVYDYARVLRVDPVIGSGYGRSSRDSVQCHESRSDDVYVGNERDYGGDRYGSNDGYVRNDRYGNDGYYGSDRYQGREDGYPRGNEASRTVATVIGGIAGAVLGSKIGDGSGRYVGTAVGSMVGGMAGRSIYDSSVRNRQVERRGTVSVCDPVPVSSRDGYYNEDAYHDNAYDDETLAGYDVTYEYANRTYHTRTNYHPGDRIRVRVDVQAE